MPRSWGQAFGLEHLRAHTGKSLDFASFPGTVLLIADDCLVIRSGRRHTHDGDDLKPTMNRHRLAGSWDKLRALMAMVYCWGKWWPGAESDHRN